MGMRGRAHTGFVGEQAAGHAEAHGLLYGNAGRAAQHCAGVEGRSKNVDEHARQVAPVAHQHRQAAHDVQQGHHRHQLFGHRHNALHTAQEDEPGHKRHQNAHHDFRHAKGGEHGVADGVGLHHIAHKAQGQNDGHREEARQEFAEAIGEGCLDIIDRATHDLAVFISAAVLLGQNRLGVVGGHAKERAHPHPEDGTGAAGDNGRGRARNVAGTHLGGHRRSQRLKAAHALVVCLFSVQRQAAEGVLQARAQLAHLNKAQANGKIHAGAHQQKQQYIVPQVVVHHLNQVCQKVHECFLSSTKLPGCFFAPG